MLVTVIVDIIIALLIVVGALLGLKFGFFAVAMKPVKWFAALVLAFTLSSTVATAIIEPIIEAPVTNQISGYLTEKCEELSVESAREELPTLLKLAAGLAGVDVDSIDGESTAEYIDALVKNLSSPMIHLISVILAFFLIYFLAKIILALAVKLINLIVNHGLIGVVNKILGCVCGCFLAFVVVWLLVIIFSYVINLPAISDTEFAKSFSGGFIYNFLKSISPLDLLLSF